MIRFSKWFLPLALIAVSAVGAYADTYGVCIGINQYPKSKDKDGKEVDSNLNGAVNDATSIKEMLMAKYSVASDHIKLVTDADANADGFVNAMKWLLTTAKSGDQVVFMYSGHGARLEDKDADNGYESCIVLSDFTPVTGKLFKSISRTFSSKGINSSFIFDSCFSGGMSRVPAGEFQIRTKSLGDLSDLGIHKKALSFDHKKFAGMQEEKKGDDSAPFMFAFAGGDDQPTIDLKLKDQPAHGLFTLLMMAVLEDNPKIAVKDMFAAINGALESINNKLKEKEDSAPHFQQKPNFEASSPERSEKPVVIG